MNEFCDEEQMATLPGGKILLYGGVDAQDRRLDDTWLLDTSK